MARSGSNPHAQLPSGRGGCRTIYAAKYSSDEGYRPKIARQLNKGESSHARRRRLHHAREGKITRLSPSSRTSRRGV
ncbi:Tn3 family transposase [Streptomyces sp. x-80]|uniref:Tn3 family transposase n=1 Tax=Streptomyces sp. x-80 TaxID=2789282 RepID=UPI00397F3D38